MTSSKGSHEASAVEFVYVFAVHVLTGIS